LKPVSSKNCKVVAYGAGVDEDRYLPFKSGQPQDFYFTAIAGRSQGVEDGSFPEEE
jgi:hypothetical protein